MSSTTNRSSHHRAIFSLRAGGLHAWARKHGWHGTDSDPLPESIKHEAANSDNPHTASMGRFALNSEHFAGQKKHEDSK